MPSRPPVLRPKTYKSPKERKAEADKKRPNASARGYGYQWKKARDAYLQIHPLCVACESKGRITAANEVDHIIPHKGDMELFWVESNWQSLCKPCHSKKTAREDGRWSSRY